MILKAILAPSKTSIQSLFNILIQFYFQPAIKNFWRKLQYTLSFQIFFSEPGNKTTSQSWMPNTETDKSTYQTDEPPNQ